MNPRLGDAWGAFLAFELEHGTTHEQREVIRKCVDAEPNQGLDWNRVVKRVAIWRNKWAVKLRRFQGAQKHIDYDWEDNAETLYNKSLNEIIKLFSEFYPKFRNGEINSYPQSNDSSFHLASELDKFSEIDLEKSYKARDLLNIIRARTTSSNKFKSAFFKDGKKKFRVKITIKKSKG